MTEPNATSASPAVEATPAETAEADRLMNEARFRGIVLNELLAEDGEDG